MESPRDESMFGFVRCCTSLFVNSYYDLEINGLEDIPLEGPVLFDAKHQFFTDIALEGEILRKIGRSGNWIMKYSLPHSFEKIGGILIYRTDDIRDGLKTFKGKREDLKKFKEKIRRVNGRAFGLVGSAYSRGELVFLHPEGCREPYRMGKINMAILDYTQGLQEKLDIEIPLFLIGMEYKSFKVPFIKDKRLPIPRSKLTVNIERLDWNTPNLQNAVYNGLERLSGFD